MNLKKDKIKSIAKKHRKSILKIINKMGKGHIGGAFSCIEILVALYYCNILNLTKENKFNKNRNRFILSKGHASIAQYVILEDLGFLDKEDLAKMNNGGILGEHPDTNIPGIECVSGSLGHGLGIGIGMALSAQLSSLEYSTYVLLGDGECYEGSIWEGAILASHLDLRNLIVIIDRNRLCIHGETEKINALDPIDKKWKSFGWNVKVINGHEINDCITSLKIRHNKKPTVIIANTIKGKGVSFMENNHKWHHGSVNDDLLEKALRELDSE